MVAEPYDPQWLVALAADQHADKPWLAEAFLRCRVVVKRTPFIIHFVDPSDPNQPGSLWQFDRNVWLTDPNEGRLVVDVLKNHQVGAVEFLDRLFTSSTTST